MGSAMKKHQCGGVVYIDFKKFSWPCRNGATIERNDGWYCWGHDPKGEVKRLKAAAKRKLLPYWRTGKPQGSK